ELRHLAGDVAVQFTLSLAFELGLWDLDTDYRGESFADVVAREIFFDVFEQALRLTEGVDGPGERGAEAGEVRTAIDRVDVIREARNIFGVEVVVLQRHFHAELAAVRQILLGLEVNRLVVQDRLALVEQLDELGDTAGIEELGGLFL